MSTFFRTITTICVIVICLISFSCSSVLINKEKYANSYKILAFNPFVLRDYHVVLAETFSGELVLILVKFEPTQPYNKKDFSRLQLDNTYRLDLHPFPDSFEFDAVPVPPGSHLSGKYIDVGYYKHKGQMIDYFDTQSLHLLLPSYSTTELCSRNRFNILIRKKPH